MTNRGDGFTVRVRPKDLRWLVKWFKLVTHSVQRVNEDRLNKANKDIYRLAKMGTMKATGELESKLSRRRIRVPNGARFITGYFDGGSNRQAEHQEFETGKVHRHTRQHYNKVAGFGRQNEKGRCSRTPEDLWAFTGYQYKANPRAKRRALALAIEHRYKAPVKFATKGGHGFVYQPNARSITAELSMLTASYLKAVTR